MTHYLPPQSIEWLAYAMAALFVIGGLVNLKPPQAFADSYARWGYPPWWHYVTATIELIGGVLLVPPQTRFWGAMLLSLLSLAAIGTLVRHGEFKRVPPGLLLFAGTAILAIRL